MATPNAPKERSAAAGAMLDLARVAGHSLGAGLVAAFLIWAGTSGEPEIPRVGAPIAAIAMALSVGRIYSGITRGEAKQLRER